MNVKIRRPVTSGTIVGILLLTGAIAEGADRHVPGDYATIQAAIDAAGPGDVVRVASGTYDEFLDIDGKVDLTIEGADPATTILRPSSTQSWAIPGYPQYDSRQVVVRVVGSTGFLLSNMTLDFDLVKGNFVHGVLFWNTTGTLGGNTLKNMSVDEAVTPGNGYYEITSYFRAPDFTDAARAEISIVGNTFIDTGRLGVATHDYIDVTVEGNTFQKVIDDFGYAIEIGSQSTGVIRGNTIHGYDTPAASDGSNSGAIYVENSFTGSLFGAPTTGVTKTVVIEDNEVYDCQWGLYVGNEFDDFAGDVDIQIVLNGNYIHDNVEGGVLVTDHDAADGSSVSVAGGNNTLRDNGDYGYFVYSQGDGDISVDLSLDAIWGHDVGIHVEDTAGGASTSTYSLAFNNCDLGSNATLGIENTVAAAVVQAEDCWWGDPTGPYHATSNPAGSGVEVTDGVDFDPFDATYSDLVVGDQLGLYCDRAVLTVNMDCSAPVQAFSFGVVYDPSVFVLTEVSYSGLAAIEGLNGGAGPENYGVDDSPAWGCAGSVDPALTGAATVYCIASNSPVPGNVIPAGNDQPVARLTFEPAPGASPGDLSPVEIVGCLGSPVWAVRTTINYQSLLPAVTDGEIEATTCKFLRGDSNHDVQVDISDPVCTLGYLFTSVGCPFIQCFDAADANDDGKIDIADPIYELDFLFRAGPMPPAPFASCGMDPTLDDDLDCPVDACS